MAKQNKSIIDPSMVPIIPQKPALDKSRGAADMFVGTANNIQNGYNGYNGYNIHENNVSSAQTMQPEKEAVVEEPKPKHRGRKKKYNGQTKDIHLVISLERYETIQQMAGFSKQTITNFIESKLDELYEKEWKDVILQLNQINYKRQAETKNQKMIP